ncbi:MAG TPA: hypothetical protein VI456_07235 [Polyangia bacterium]
MKHGGALGLLGVLAFASSAHAQNRYLCCDLAAGDTSTACVASAQACTQQASFSVMLSDLDPTMVPDGNADNPLALSTAFPDGTDGYLYWSTTSPHLGFCLVAPVPGDPMHIARLDPLGCLEVTLKPGVSGEMARVVVPVDPRWDGYELCYGAPDPTEGCQNLNDGMDATISQTPISRSCCGPVELFRTSGVATGTWVFELDQDLPGIPPPVLIAEPDAGLVSYFNAANNDVTLSSADAGCLTAYNETPTCGSLPPDAGSPSPSAVPSAATDAGAIDMAGPAEAPVGCSLAPGRPRAPQSLLAVALIGVLGSRRRHRRPGTRHVRPPRPQAIVPA